MKKLIITIDGPAASGKEKIAKYISKKWKLNHLDSGILYRRLALIFLTENIDFKNGYLIGNIKLPLLNNVHKTCNDFKSCTTKRYTASLCFLPLCTLLSILGD